MENIEDQIDMLNWELAFENLTNTGHHLFKSLIANDACNDLIVDYDNSHLYRKTIVMERYRFGLGEYRYMQYPLPEHIETLRRSVYERLSPLANRWMEALKIDQRFPYSHTEFKILCRDKGQTKPTVLILKYGPGGHNTLHQDLYGDVFFPIQAVIFLSEPKEDYTGGEFVLTEQTPRAQSRAIVLQPNKGDMLLFTTNFRPVKGSKGYYRSNMKHGVSEVHHGNRYTLGIIFHDAIS